jgi:hypothetical protein
LLHSSGYALIYQSFMLGSLVRCEEDGGEPAIARRSGFHRNKLRATVDCPTGETEWPQQGQRSAPDRSKEAENCPSGLISDGTKLAN